MAEAPAQAEEGVKHDESVEGVRLLTPTRPQWTRNGLEADLLIQVAFSRRVSDAVTQPILRARGMRIAPSLVLHLYTDLPGRPSTHLVEVDAGDGRLDAATLAAGRAWCATHGAGFHVVDERTIRTACLGNARLMTPYVGLWPVDEDVDAICASINAGGGTCPASAAIDAIVACGVPEVDADHAVKQAVANWIIECDLSRPFDRSSPLVHLDPGSYWDSTKDPFLALLLDSSIRGA